MAVSRGAASGPIERASAADLVMLAMEGNGRLPEQLGAVLVFGPGSRPDAVAMRRELVDRARRVVRLRQRLVRVPPGCGRRIWVDDPSARPEDHVRLVSSPAPGDERVLLDLAAEIVADPLPRSRPLWSAALVTDLAGGAAALVLVVHHVLADGIAGLSILTSLLDPDPVGSTRAFPQPRPGLRALAADAVTTRLRALTKIRAAWQELRATITAAGGLHPPLAADCSLLHPTGRRCRFAVAHVDLGALRAVAHRHGGTVNDALLAAVAGALRSVLHRRGETVATFRIAVMVTASRSAPPGRGNLVAPLVIDLPSAGDPVTQLTETVGRVRAGRASASHPPMLALLYPMFRLLAAVGLYRAYMARQRRMHTLVSNVRGPARQLTLAGTPVHTMIPVGVGEAGNLTVSFLALSYAGSLTVTVAVDPERVPELGALAAALQDELDALAGSAAGSRRA
jgi:WS/DGAT/MGAT family acyltransferase